MMKIVCYRCAPAIADALARPRSEERGSATKLGFPADAGTQAQRCQPCASKSDSCFAYLSRSAVSHALRGLCTCI